MLPSTAFLTFLTVNAFSVGNLCRNKCRDISNSGGFQSKKIVALDLLLLYACLHLVYG